MKAILALGNPGVRYRDTRHNVGWWLADRLCAVWRLPAFREDESAARTAGEVVGTELVLIKPLTYVNRAGEVAGPLGRRVGFDLSRDLLVLVDDVWLDPGSIRLRARGSPGGHNGLASIERAVGSEDYCRLRIGVGRPRDQRIDLAEWVLAPVPAAEEEAILSSFPRAVKATECWLDRGIQQAMNSFNRS